MELLNVANIRKLGNDLIQLQLTGERTGIQEG
jgi:hypothetical protein